MSKTILITGAASGFGLNSAETLARQGHNVFATMRGVTGKNEACAQSLRDKSIHVVELDVTSTESVDHAVDAVLSEAGSIDVLLNNAGVASIGITEAFTAQQLTTLFDVNVIGLHRTTRKVLPIFREKNDGLIINLSSILGRITFPFWGIYGASKFAVEAYTDSLRYEVSQFGVDVALVQPSAYPTDMYSSAAGPSDTERVASYGEIGEIPSAMFSQFMSMFEADNAPDPHDVAQAISTLVSAPKGQRAFRTVVGADFGADAVNDATSSHQTAAIQALGLDHLEQINLV